MALLKVQLIFFLVTCSGLIGEKQPKLKNAAWMERVRHGKFSSVRISFGQIDYSEDRIWWTDARFGTIESVDLNGGDRKVALRSSRARYTFGISLFQDSIFVAKRQGGRKILKVDKSGGKRSVTLLRYLYGPRGIVVYHPSRQPGTGQNCVLSMCLNMTE